MLTRTDHRCSSCGDFLMVNMVDAFTPAKQNVVTYAVQEDGSLHVEEVLCSACVTAKKAIAKANRKSSGRDPKTKVLTEAAMKKRRKWALKKLGVLDPCQRRLGRKKCGIAKGEHGAFPPLLPNGCCGWTNATAKEQKEAKLVLIKKEKEEKAAKKAAAAYEKERLAWRKHIADSQAKREKRKALKRTEKKLALLLFKQGEQPEAMALLEALVAAERVFVEEIPSDDSGSLSTLLSLKLAYESKTEADVIHPTKSGIRLVKALQKKEQAAKDKEARARARAKRLARKMAKKAKESQMKVKVKSKSKKSAAKKTSKKAKGAKKDKSRKNGIAGGDKRLPKAGTVLKVKRGGKTLKATVLADGVKFQGKKYKSLSGAASDAAESVGLGRKQGGYTFWGLNGK